MIRLSPVVLALYIGTFIFGAVSDLWLLREKCPLDNCLGGIGRGYCSGRL